MTGTTRCHCGRTCAALIITLVGLVLAGCTSSDDVGPVELQPNRAASEFIPPLVAQAAQGEDVEEAGHDLMGDIGARQFELAQDDEYFDVPWVVTELLDQADIAAETRADLLDIVTTYANSESFRGHVDRRLFEEQLLAAAVDIRLRPENSDEIAEALTAADKDNRLRSFDNLLSDEVANAIRTLRGYAQDRFNGLEIRSEQSASNPPTGLDA